MMTEKEEFARTFARQIKAAFTRPAGAPPPEPWTELFSGPEERLELTEEQEHTALAETMDQLAEYETVEGGASYFEIPAHMAEILLRYIRRLEANQAE